MDAKTAVRQAFAANLRDAFLDLLRREGKERMSREELGQRVAKELRGGHRDPPENSTRGKEKRPEGRLSECLLSRTETEFPPGGV